MAEEDRLYLVGALEKRHLGISGSQERHILARKTIMDGLSLRKYSWHRGSGQFHLTLSIKAHVMPQVPNLAG